MFEKNLWINSHLKVRKSHLSSPKALRSSSKFSLLFIFQVPVKFCILCGFDCVSAERLLSSVSSAAFLQAFSLRFSPSVPVLPPFLLPMCNDPSWQTKPPRPLPPLPLNRHIYTPTHTHTHISDGLFWLENSFHDLKLLFSFKVFRSHLICSGNKFKSFSLNSSELIKQRALSCTE